MSRPTSSIGIKQVIFNWLLKVMMTEPSCSLGRAGLCRERFCDAITETINWLVSLMMVFFGRQVGVRTVVKWWIKSRWCSELRLKLGFYIAQDNTSAESQKSRRVGKTAQWWSEKYLVIVGWQTLIADWRWKLSLIIIGSGHKCEAWYHRRDEKQRKIAV